MRIVSFKDEPEQNANGQLFAIAAIALSLQGSADCEDDAVEKRKRFFDCGESMIYVSTT